MIIEDSWNKKYKRFIALRKLCEFYQLVGAVKSRGILNARRTSEKEWFVFACSLIEYIARKTNNTKKYIVEKIGTDTLQKIYDLADVYHSENIEKVCYELIHKFGIEEGIYDIISKCKYSVPSY